MPRWEPNARMRLVEAALELFEAQGYDHTGVSEIAAQAGLTKTTYFRHFPDKREVLFAGQDEHVGLIREAIAGAPVQASPLELASRAVAALAGTMNQERHAFAVRLRAVVDAHSELREREALKHLGYLAAIQAGLEARGVPQPTAAVAADLGMLAFKTAFADWTRAATPPPLVDLVSARLDELRAASAALR